MNNLLLDPPHTEHPVQSLAPTSAEPSVEAAKSARRSERAGSGAVKQEAKHEETRWPLGAHITIAAVALFLLAMLVIIAIFSVPAAALVTFDGVVAIGILVLSLALSMLMAVANRRPGA